MRVLVLHQHYWPEIAATAQILSDLCEDLAAAGHDVTVVCGQPSYHASANAPRLPSHERHNAVEVRRVWSHTPANRSIPQRLVHYGTYYLSSLAAALTQTRPDVCLVMSTPPLLLGISGTILSALRGVPFVYSVQDLYPDIAVHLGVISPNGPLTKLVSKVANGCYGAAAELITLSGGMRERLIAKGVAADRVHVVHNWADASSVTPVPRDNALARELGLTDSFVVQYSGNVGQSQGLEHVLTAAEQLRDHPIQFVIAGEGAARAALVETATRKKLDKVRFVPPQPRERLAELLGSCDVGLVTMKRNVGDDLVPSKLYGIMASGRPVLAAVESTTEVARVLNECRCGIVVRPEDPTALADGVMRVFRASEAERRRWGEAGRQACVVRYSRAALTHRYEEVLSKAANLRGAIKEHAHVAERRISPQHTSP